MQQRTPQQVIDEREQMVNKLEEADRSMRASGLQKRWFSESDEATRGVASNCNGALLEILLKATKYDDWECCYMLRHGAEIVGVIPECGVGEHVDKNQAVNPQVLWESRKEANSCLVSTLRSDEYSEWLLENARAEAGMGRLSTPRVVDEHACVGMILQPRFAVRQIRADGTTKLRPIDHFSWSPGKGGREHSVNGHTTMNERFRHHTLDHLMKLMMLFMQILGEPPGIFKADIDSAFRRIPVKSTHRWACGIAFKVGEQVFCAQHYACPLGAVGSVIAWERLGKALLHNG
eukprot:12416188-Karenia_brevis.AAC.1